MSFSITGNLVSRKDTKQVSDTFKVREFAIKVENDGKYENFAGFQAVQDKTEMLDGLKKGDLIKVHFDLRGREHEGRYFTNLTAWKIEKLDAAAAPAAEPKKAPEPAYSTGDDESLPF